jgi:hypothetical protein
MKENIEMPRSYLFSELNRIHRGANALYRFFVRAGKGDVAQLIPVMENVIADGNVYHNGKKNTNPNRNVVRVNSDQTLVGTDPAPHLKYIRY